MKIVKIFRTELDLNNSQKTACIKHSNAARYAYNWGLARKLEALKANKKIPSAFTLHRELNALKKTELGWMYEVSKCAPEEALRDLDIAFGQFFRRVRRKREGKFRGKTGLPNFRSKKQGLRSFRLSGHIHVFERAIQLPRLGRLRLKEQGYLPANGVKVFHAIISERAGHWFVCLAVETDLADPDQVPKPIVGVDLGIKSLASLSDGTVIPNPRPLKRNLRKIRRLHRAVARKKKDSANRRKAVARLAHAYWHISNIRRNTLHQATTQLAKTKSVIVLEDLNVRGLMRNHRLAFALSEVGMGEFRRQMEYKAGWYGCAIVFAPRFYPSSKMCSHCGQVKEALSLKERVFHCDQCGFTCDRDLNAARNLEKLAVSSTDTQNACGEDVRPSSLGNSL